MIVFMTRKAPDYIKFRAEALKAIGLALSIPFADYILDLLRGNFENFVYKSLFSLPISISLLYLGYFVVDSATKSIKGAEQNEY